MATIPTINSLKEEIADLKNRLNGCSDCIVGRRRRKEIAGMIQRREKQIYKIEALCIHQ